jgi:hypothetical protein
MNQDISEGGKGGEGVALVNQLDEPSIGSVMHVTFNV